MAQKAIDDFTTVFPPDDRWLVDREACARLTPRFGYQPIAEDAITLALRQNDLHCLNCYRTVDGWERRLVSFLCWTTIEWMERPVLGGQRRRIDLACSLPAKVKWVRNPVHFLSPGLGQRGSVLYFWRPDLERLWPAVFPPAAEPEVRSIATKKWISAEAERLKRLDKIPDGISMTAFAQQLANNLEDEARTNRLISVRVVSWKYLRNYLRDWGLWPISAIQ